MRKSNYRYACSCAAFSPFGTLITSVDRFVSSGLYDALRYPASILVRKLRGLLDMRLLRFHIVVHDVQEDDYK